MKPRLICVPVALQRYLDLPPVALRQRDVAGLIARSTGAELLVLSVDAPVALVAQLESTPEKLARLGQPLRDDGLTVQVLHREGDFTILPSRWLNLSPDFPVPVL